MKLMTGDELFISEETFNKIAQLPQLSGPLKITEIGGIINLSSISSLLREDIAKSAESNNQKTNKCVKLHDGIIAIKRGGEWINEYSGTRIDQKYYPELLKDLSDNEFIRIE